MELKANPFDSREMTWEAVVQLNGWLMVTLIVPLLVPVAMIPRSTKTGSGACGM